MITASLFSSPPDGEFAICIIHGCVKYGQPNEYDLLFRKRFPSMSRLPQVTVCTLPDRYPLRTYTIPRDGKLKIFRDEWRQRGLILALEEILLYESADSKTAKVIRCLLFMWKYWTTKSIDTRKLRDCAVTRDWSKSFIRYVTWHPNTAKIAIVLNNDCVQIYNSGNGDHCKVNHNLQRDVTCIAFRPLSKQQLAVGCAAGVFVWYCNYHNTVDVRFSFVILDEQKYVSCLSWNSRGKLLATCSVFDHSIYVWDVSMRTKLVINRYGSGNASLLSWSPDSKYLFSNSTQSLLRIWYVQNQWKLDNVRVPCGRITNGCWSPCSKLLLFSILSKPLIYLLTIDTFEDDTTFSVTPVIDFTSCELSSGKLLGGDILQMVWDQKGIYLAVTFKRSNFVALISTLVSNKVMFIPRCVIEGEFSEEPAGISFQNEFHNGANLLIVWSSGRIQYFPCLQEQFNGKIIKNETNNSSLRLNFSHC